MCIQRIRLWVFSPVRCGSNLDKSKYENFSFIIIILDMNILVALTAGIALVNVVLLVSLLTIYARIYKNTKASFTIGLMFFAGMLILHNIIAVYAYFAMESLYSMDLLPFFVVIHLSEFAGIAVLLKVTL